ncbi:MAG: hypothetical protein JF887_10675 [Candidatus Dormibacteraeota bacterium]|uniref:Uncharacterized protein n=1 Tax=Candidatus Amunia macphersoniae TaxID=3127014 RepID=A0A934KNY6_9BACT|nr:hypothetical protein [Candidatus Dormibacteraeota bacterium]
MNASSRSSRALALLGCVAVLATFVAYSLLLQQQATDLGESPGGPFGALRGAPTWVLAALAASAAADGAAIWLPPGRGRRMLLLGTAVVLAAVGVVATFSIGLPLLLAAGLTAGAGAQDPGRDRLRRSA